MFSSSFSTCILISCTAHRTLVRISITGRHFYKHFVCLMIIDEEYTYNNVLDNQPEESRSDRCSCCLCAVLASPIHRPAHPRRTLPGAGLPRATVARLLTQLPHVPATRLALTSSSPWSSRTDATQTPPLSTRHVIGIATETTAISWCLPGRRPA